MSLYRLLILVVAISALNQSCTCQKPLDSIKIDGSSTVYVISEAIAEEFKATNKSPVSIGVSGTGGGFKKLCSNRIGIIGASRAIKQSEVRLCQENQVEALSLPVAYDGIVVVVNKKNNWVDEIRVSELKKLFEPAAEGKIMKWSDIDQKWPNKNLEIFAPGVSSGTYDYFTKAVIGKEHASRGDITSSEDDNVLVHGVRSNENAIGFFSFAYYLENKNELKALAVVDDKNSQANQGILPSKNAIRNGSYSPLSRPVFLYTNLKILSESERNFLSYYISNSQKICEEVGFVSLDQATQEKTLVRLKQS